LSTQTRNVKHNYLQTEYQFQNAENISMLKGSFSPKAAPKKKDFMCSTQGIVSPRERLIQARQVAAELEE